MFLLQRAIINSFEMCVNYILSIKGLKSMMNKSRFLKNLLTSTSTIASTVAGTIAVTSALTAASANALAVPIISVNGGAAAQFSVNTDWKANGAIATPLAGDNVIFGKNQDMTLNVLADTAYGTLNAYGFSKTITLSNAITASFTDIVNNRTDAAAATANGAAAPAGGALDAKVNFNIGANGTMEFKNILALGNTTLSSPNAKARFVTDNVVVTGTINSVAGNEGIIEVNANNVTFQGAIGGTASVGNFTVLDGKSATITNDFKIEAGKIEISIGNNATLNFGDGTKNIQITGNVDGIADNQGILKFNGPLTFNSNVGNNHVLAEVDFLSGTVNLTGVFLRAQNINFSTGSVLKLSQDNTDITGLIKAVNDGDGKIQINASDPSIIGNIGVDKKLGSIEFLVNKTLTLSSTKAGENLEIHVAQVSTNIPNQGTLVFKGDTVLVDGNFGTNTAPIDDFTIQSNFTGTGPATVTLAPGASIFANNGLFLDTGKGGLDNILVLGEGTQVKTTIYTATDGNGIVKIAGNSVVKQISSDGSGGGELINYLEFTTADKTLTIEEKGDADGVDTKNGIKFSEDATLSYTGKDSFTLSAPVEVKQDKNGAGSILANNIPAKSLFTFDNKTIVGDVTVTDKYLKLLQVKGGADITLEANAAIGTLDVGSQDVKLTLDTKNSEYFIGKFIHDDGKGTLIFNEDATLKAGSFKDDNKLKLIQFNGDYTITVEDGVNLGATTGIKTNAKGDGLFLFEGASIIDAVVGANIAINRIIVDSDGKAVDFKKDVIASSVLGISDKGVAVLWGQFTGLGISGWSHIGKGVALNDVGTLRFNNATPVTVTAAIGDPRRLDAVEINGSDVTFDEAYSTTRRLSFTGTGNSTVTFGDGSAINADHFQNTVITSASTSRGHNIVLMKGEDQQFDKAVGSKDNPFGNFVLSDDDKITINSQNFYAGVTTNAKNQGTVNFATGGSFAFNLGAADSRLKVVEFSASGTVKKDVFSNSIVVNKNITARFEGMTSSTGVMSLADDAIASFASGSTLDAVISPATTNNNGTASFEGDVSLLKTIGFDKNLNTAIFTGNGAAKLGANINAVNITFTNGIKAVANTDNVVLNGTTIGSAFDVGSNKITFQNGESKLTGPSTISVTIGAGGTVGQFVVDGSEGAASLNLNNASEFTILVNNNASDNVDAQYTLFTTSKNGMIIPVDNAKVAVVPVNTDRFTTWSYDSVSNILSRKNITTQVISQSVSSIADPNILSDALSLANPGNTDDAKAVLIDFAKISNNADLVDAVRRLTTPVETIGEVVNDISSAGRQVVSNRLGVLSPTPGVQLSEATSSGIAAGDDSSNYGAWGSPFYNQTTQKPRKGAAGYKATTTGGTVGFDIMANNDLTVGIAGTLASTSVKHKDYKSGDSTKANSFVFSVYGIQQLTNEWFMQGVASFSGSDVTNKENRRTSSGLQVAQGKFESSILSGDFVLGYLQKVSNITFVPSFGVGVTRINDGGYKETGTTNQNLDVTKKSIAKLEGIAGLKVQAEMLTSGVSVMPELHAVVRHDVLGKKASVTVKLEGLTDSFKPKTTRPTRTNYNLGLGVNAKAGIFEYGAGYDAVIANQYLSHQGTVKVRVNF